MDILYVDLEKHELNEILLMVQQLERFYDKERNLLVVPKDCRFVENASYSELLEIKTMIDKALEEKEKKENDL